MLLWEEYRTVHSGGYGYSRFCDLFRGFERRLSPTMRQEHVAGDKVFVDCSGKKLSIVDPLTEIREAEIFVAALGACGLSYAEATWTQMLPDWMGAHMRMFNFFGGVPRLVVPGNLKSGPQPWLLLRFGDQPQLRHDGFALRCRRPADPATAPEGQGRRSRTGFVSPRPASSDDCGGKPSSRGRRPMLRSPGRSTGSTTMSCAASASAVVICSRPWKSLPWPACRRRITSSPNGAWPASPPIITSSSRVLLFRAPRAHPPAGRYPRDIQDDRDIPPRQAGRRSPAPLWRAAIRHQSRAYAQFPLSLRRVDAGALSTMGCFDRAAPKDLSSPSWQAGRIPSRASERVWASCAFIGISIVSVPRLYRLAPSRTGGLTCKRIAALITNHKTARPPAGPGAIVDHANLRGPGYFH